MNHKQNLHYIIPYNVLLNNSFLNKCNNYPKGMVYFHKIYYNLIFYKLIRNNLSNIHFKEAVMSHLNKVRV